MSDGNAFSVKLLCRICLCGVIVNNLWADALPSAMCPLAFLSFVSVCRLLSLLRVHVYIWVVSHQVNVV